MPRLINTSPNFKSYDALKEATGYIVGMGFKFIAKQTINLEKFIWEGESIYLGK